MAHRIVLSGICSIAALACAQLAQAQTTRTADTVAPDGGQAAADDTVREIIVTAMKRSQPLQRVPAAVSVVDDTRLTSAGVSNLTQISNLAPGINVVPVRTQAFIFIRGVGQSLTSPNADPSVATNLNGVYLPAEIAGTAFFDVDRIELLPGPQGTLYGRNSTGGVVNITSRKPKDSFGVDGFIEYGNYDRIQGVVGVDVPLTSALRSRTAATIIRHDGYFNNGEDDQRTTAVRQTLVWTPGEATTVTGVATYTHDGGIGSVLQNIPYQECGARCANFDPKALGYFNRSDSFQGSLQVEHRINDALTMTYVGGYSHLKIHVYNSIWTGPPVAPLDFREKIGSQSHELRLNGSLGKLQTVVGAYYFDGTAFQRINPRPVPALVVLNAYDAPSHGYAAFGQLTYPLSGAVRLTGGLRYSNTVKRIDGFNSQFTATGVQLLNRPYVGRSTLHRTDWKAGVEVDLPPTSMLYANVATGFTPGGFSSEPAVVGQPGAAPFKPVTLRAYSAGVKSRLFNNSLTVNLEGFYYDYKNYQVSVRLVADGRSPVFNADKSTVYGAQIDANLAITRDDNFSVSAVLLHARADRLTVAGINYDGLDLPYAPRLTVNAAYAHSFELANEAHIKGNINFQYVTGQWSIYSHLPEFYTAKHSHTDANLGYFAPDDRWSISAFVRNIENTVVRTKCESVPPPGVTGCFFEAPRTYGVRLGFNF